MKSFINKNILGVSLIIGFISLFLFYYPVSAAEKKLESALKEATDQADTISDIINNQDLSAEEKEQKELSARSEALSKILDLTVLENNDLENNLNSFKNLNKNLRDLRDKLLNVLSENKKVYDLIQERLDKASSSEEIRQLAVDFKNWRSLVYKPKTEKITAFNLVVQEKNIIAMAQDRINKINNDFDNLREAQMVKKELLYNLLETANGKIDKASALENQAESLMILTIKRDLFPQNLSLFERFQVKLLSKETKPIQSLIEDSHQNIKEAYKIFIDLSRAIKELINN